MTIEAKDVAREFERLRHDFPFPGYITTDKGHQGVALMVSSLVPHGSRILDVGSGPMDKTALVSRLGFQCTAVDDLDDEWHREGDAVAKIERFAREEGIKFYRSISELPVEDVYDVIMLHDVLEHLHDSPKLFLTSLVRRLKPGGYVYLTIPNHANLRKRIDLLRGRTTHPSYDLFYNYPPPWRGHIREYTRGDCDQLVDFLGLELHTLIGVHHMLEKVPPRAMGLYKAISRAMPNTRDTWALVARRPKNWGA